MVDNRVEINRAIVLFDCDCNFCDSTVQYIIKYDKKYEIRFASQQSGIGIKIMKENDYHNIELNTIIFINKTGVFVKMDALIEISKLLIGYPSLFILFKIIPPNIRNYFYDIFSKHHNNLFCIKAERIIPNNEIRMKFLDLNEKILNSFSFLTKGNRHNLKLENDYVQELVIKIIKRLS